jgi:hypothetical protein
LPKVPEVVRTRMNTGASPHHRMKAEKPGKGMAAGPPGPTCPTCGCSVHPQPRTWEVVCTSCGEKRWPLAVLEPGAYVCRRCRGTSPEKRAAARAAGKKSAEARRKLGAR